MTAVRKVLVVDDDPVVSKSFDRVLGRKGYIVVSAADGPEALSKAATEEFDAVFTDIRMPGMDGVAVAEQLRAKRPWTPVVIITGYGSAENEVRAEAAGVHAFLRKPLSPEMIEETLAAATAAEASSAPARDVAAVPAATAEPEVATSFGRKLAHVGMFFAAPFIGLAYVMLFPLIGLFMLARLAIRARHAPQAAD